MESTSLAWSRRTHVFRSASPLVIAVLLFQTPPEVSGFGQGVQIQANFGVYCNRRASQRFPVHADVIRCRGLCAPKNDVRNVFAMRVNATSYFSETIQVTVLASRRGGFSNNIRGFAIVAMTEDERIVGGFAEHPDALIASCDPLMEGDTAFHARASLNRRQVSLTWLPGSRNYGRVRFRAWIVVQHYDVYMLDSHYLHNEVSGTDQLDLMDHFHTFILRVFNISRAAVTFVADDDTDEDDGGFITISNDANNNNTDDSDEGQFKGLNTTSMRTEDAVLSPLNANVTSLPSSLTPGTGSAGISISDDAHFTRNTVSTATNRGSTTAATGTVSVAASITTSTATTNPNTGGNGRRSNNVDDSGPNGTVTNNTVSVVVSLSNGRDMKLTIPSLAAFESTFQRRLMTSSYDVKAQDLFSEVKKEVPSFEALLPKRSTSALPGSSDAPLTAPFAPVAGSPFFPGFGSRSSSRSRFSPTTRIRQTFNRVLSPLGSRGAFGSQSGIPGQTPFGVNQFGRGANQLGTATNQFRGPPNQFGTALNQFGTGTNLFGSAANPFGAAANQFGDTTNQFESPVPFNPTNQNSNKFGGNQLGSRNPFNPNNQNSNQFGGQFGTVTNPFGRPGLNSGISSSVNTFQQPNTGFPWSLNRFGQPQSGRTTFFGNPNSGNISPGSAINTGGSVLGFPRNSNPFLPPDTNSGFQAGNGLNPSRQFPGAGSVAAPNGFGANSQTGFPTAGSIHGRLPQFANSPNSGSGFNLFPGLGQQQQRSGSGFDGRFSSPLGMFRQQQGAGSVSLNPFSQRQFQESFVGGLFPQQVPGTVSGNQLRRQQFQGRPTGNPLPQPQFLGTFAGNQLPQRQFPGTSSHNLRRQFPGSAVPGGSLLLQQQFPRTASANPFLSTAAASINSGVSIPGTRDRPASSPTNFGRFNVASSLPPSFFGSGTFNTIADRAPTSTGPSLLGGGLAAQLGSFPNGPWRRDL